MKKLSLLILITAGLAAFYHSRANIGDIRPEREDLRLSGQVEVQEAAPDTPVQVIIQVDEPTLGRIRPGRPARVRTNSGSLYEGRVGLISDRVENEAKNAGNTSPANSPIYRLRVLVDQPGPDLRQGLPVTVELPQTSN